MLPLNAIEEEMKQVCTDYMKGGGKMEKAKRIIIVVETDESADYSSIQENIKIRRIVL